MARFTRRALRTLIHAQGQQLDAAERGAEVMAARVDRLNVQRDSAIGSIARLRATSEEHRVRSAEFGAILQDIAHGWPTTIDAFSDIPRVIADDRAALQAENVRLHDRIDEGLEDIAGIRVDMARAAEWRNIVAAVRDLLPSSVEVKAPVDVSEALATVFEDLREERQKALSRAAEAERRQLTAERLAAQFGSRLTPDQRADAHAAIAASEAGNG